MQILTDGEKIIQIILPSAHFEAEFGDMVMKENLPDRMEEVHESQLRSNYCTIRPTRPGSPESTQQQNFGKLWKIYSENPI